MSEQNQNTGFERKLTELMNDYASVYGADDTVEIDTLSDTSRKMVWMNASETTIRQDNHMMVAIEKALQAGHSEDRIFEIVRGTDADTYTEHMEKLHRLACVRKIY